MARTTPEPPSQDTAADTGRSLVLGTGLTGMLGAVVFLVADLLLYLSTGGERDFVEIMSEVPLWRLSLSGALGIVGGWLYTLGAWQVYRAVRPEGSRLAAATFGALAAMTIGMGAFHAVHACLGLVGRAARLAGADRVATQQALDQT